MSEQAQEAESDEERNRRELERWAFSRVKEWGKPESDDYDFSTWTTGASKERLIAGALYESARESLKLRCLLVLMDKRRPREAWEMVRPGNVNGRKPDPSDSFATFPCSFDGWDEHAAEAKLGGFLWCLRDLADYIADNVSFGELFRTKRDELKKAFGGLDTLARVRSEHRYFLPIGEAIQVATRSQIQDITTAETLGDEKERILLGEAGCEVIAFQVAWGKITPNEFVEAMKKFDLDHRPRNAACKAPQRKGQRPDEVVLAYLKALSAMRIWKLHERDPWKRLTLLAKFCGYQGCVKETEAYRERCSDGRGDLPMSDAAKVAMTKARDHALSLFQSIFEGELPSNY